MEDYKKSRIVELMMFLAHSIAPLLQGIGWWMMEWASRPTEVAWGIGDTLVLGCDANPFANVIGSPDFGYRPMGLCANNRAMLVERFQTRRLRSWTRFQTARTPQEVNMDAKFKYVFIFPTHDWETWKDWVAEHTTEDATVIVAQEMPFEEPEGDFVYLRKVGKKTCKLANRDSADVIVFVA